MALSSPSKNSFGPPVEITERLVVSPASGTFEPLPSTTAGAPVCKGQVVGHVRCGGRRVQVTSPFDGQLRQVLAWQNERVYRFQPIMWMTGR